MKRSTEIATKAPEHTMAPTGRRKALTKVRFVNNYSLLPKVYGRCQRRDDDTIRVDLNPEVVAGLTKNSRNSWLTFFHECAHVVFGDLDTTAKTDAEHDARENRAERFAEFMISAINDVLSLSVAEHVDPQIQELVSEEKGRRMRALGVPDGVGPRDMAEHQFRAFVSVLDQSSAIEREHWRAFWADARHEPSEHEAFATYGAEARATCLSGRLVDNANAPLAVDFKLFHALRPHALAAH